MTSLEPILGAVRQAALLCARVQQSRYERSDKATDDPVTVADYGAQAILCRAIHQAFPGEMIYAEEKSSQFLALVSDEQRAFVVQTLTDVLDEIVTQDDVITWLDYGSEDRSARAWAIDPVDGTKGFIGGRHFAIAVCAIVNGEVEDGILGCPGYEIDGVMGQLFYTRDGGAAVEPLLDSGPARPVRVSTVDRMDAARVVESVVWQHADLDVQSRVREAAGILPEHIDQIDSSEKYALVANGDAEVYMRLPRESTPRHWIWDHAAGVALVHAAGGRVTDLDGSPLDFSQGVTLARNRGMVATNGLVHDRVVAAIQATLG